MFSVIRHYHFDAKNGAEIDGKIRESFVPLIKKAKGFVRYYWLDTDKGEGASLSVFQDKAGADSQITEVLCLPTPRQFVQFICVYILDSCFRILGFARNFFFLSVRDHEPISAEFSWRKLNACEARSF